jgi:hypothetical protein
MKIILHLGVIFGATVILATSTRAAQESCFFRIVSTQETYIVSLDSKGLLTWTNAVDDAPCQVAAKRSLDGVWTNNLPTSPIQRTGHLAHVRVPLCRVLERWIVAFQPDMTLQQAGVLLDSYEMVWQPLAFDSLKMAVVYLPPGKSIIPLSGDPKVRYVEPDGIWTTL